MVALIDFDSIFYIIGHTYRDADSNSTADKYAVKKSVDSMLDMILTMTGATNYILAVSKTDIMDYRKSLYKYAEYKGNRGLKPEFIEKWQYTIKMHIGDKWNITTATGFEADDVIATVAKDLRERNILHVICSPDKDLLQIPGNHWNYAKADTQDMKVVTPEQANLTYWIQVLSGDSTDNVAGVPGMGPVKAALVLKDRSPVEYKYCVEQAYIKYFGPYYGPIIMQENIYAIKLSTDCLSFVELATYVPSHEREFF